MTAGTTIDYEALTQEALRGIVRTILVRAAKYGLPGEHHFYISFRTLAPGVTLSKRLREKYPNEMTIVLQHRFWDLVVTDERFDVKLTFDGIPERIIVPFAAIKVFYDPSVRYGMHFEEGDDPNSGAEVGQAVNFDPEADEFNSGHSHKDAPVRTAAVRSSVPRRPRPVKKLRDEKETPAAVALRADLAAPSRPQNREGDAGLANPPEEMPVGRERDARAPEGGGAEIVRLDAFRKK